LRNLVLIALAVASVAPALAQSPIELYRRIVPVEATTGVVSIRESVSREIEVPEKCEDGLLAAHSEVTGTFSMHGESRELSTIVEVRPIPADVAKQAGLGKGIRVSAPFEVKLSDFGVAIPKKSAQRVNDTWKVNLTARRLDGGGQPIAEVNHEVNSFRAWPSPKTPASPRR